MFFLIRAFFWIGIVFLLMPQHGAPPQAPAARTSSGQGSSVVGTLVRDGASLCLKRPQDCRTGLDTARRVGARIDRGTKLVAALFGDMSHDASSSSQSPWGMSSRPPIAR